MLTLGVVERTLWWLEVAGYLVLYVCLLRERLCGVYRFFSAFLAFSLLRAVALMAAPTVGRVLGEAPKPDFSSSAYFWTWFVTEPVQWVLYILVVLELYGLVLQNYKGIASLGRWAIFTGLAISLVIASLTLPVDFSNAGERFPVLRYMHIMERGVVSSLALFLILMGGFLASFPVSLSRNIIVYSIGYAVYFLSLAATVLVRNVGGVDYVGAANIADSGLTVACLIAWILFLNRRGESRPVTLRQHWEPAREQYLIEQLAAINSTLLRAPRKG